MTSEQIDKMKAVLDAVRAASDIERCVCVQCVRIKDAVAALDAVDPRPTMPKCTCPEFPWDPLRPFAHKPECPLHASAPDAKTPRALE